MIFWKILKKLSERLDIYMIDILGMGGSSRPDFTITNPDEIE